MKLAGLSPKQQRSIARARARVNLWHGSVRSGKTLASLIRWAYEIEQHDGDGALLMVGKTERTLARNCIDPLIELLGQDAVRLRAGAGEVEIFDRMVYLVGANDERAEQKIRGGTFAKIYGDEVTLWPESFFKMALTRMSPPGAKFFGSTNPDSPLHWLKREFIDREGELDLRAFHFELRDNPGLTPEYLAALEKEFTGLWRKRFILGLWVMAEGAIWDGFDPDVQVLDSVPATSVHVETGEEVELTFRRYFVGVDYGTANPFVALMIGEGSDGRLWVLDEYRWDSRERLIQRTDAQYSADLRDWIEDFGSVPSAIYVDPSAASFVTQLNFDHDWNVIPAENDVLDGLRVVGNYWAGDRLRVIGPKCPGLLPEIPSYAWDPKAQQRGEDKPLKIADHGPDGLRYGIYSHERLDPGDLDQYGWL